MKKPEFVLFALSLACLLQVGCNKQKIELNCSGTVTDFYTQAPITSGFVMFSPERYDYSSPDGSSSSSNFQLGGIKYGAIVNADGTYEFSIEENNSWYENQWNVVYFDSTYISDTYTLMNGEASTINITCKPYTTLCLRIDFWNSSTNQVSLDIYSDGKINDYDTLFPSPIVPFQVSADTLYFRVIPEEQSIVSGLHGDDPFVYFVDILKSDTTFYDILII